MQFVAASKLKRAQDATLAARPYSEKLDEVLADVAAVLSGDEHPLLAKADPAGKRLAILITTDRPLAGPLTSNAVRFTLREIVDHAGDMTIVTVGRKGRDAIRRARRPDRGPFRRLRRPAHVRRRAAPGPPGDRRLPVRRRTPGSTSSITLFVSTLTQRPTLGQLLPIVASRGHRRHPRQPVHLRAEPGGGPRAAPAALRRDPPLPGGPRGEGQRGVEPDGRDEERDRERRGADRGPDPGYNKVRQANITREMIEIATGAQAR